MESNSTFNPKNLSQATPNGAGAPGAAAANGKLASAATGASFNPNPASANQTGMQIKSSDFKPAGPKDAKVPAMNASVNSFTPSQPMNASSSVFTPNTMAAPQQSFVPQGMPKMPTSGMGFQPTNQHIGNTWQGGSQGGYNNRGHAHGYGNNIAGGSYGGNQYNRGGNTTQTYVVKGSQPQQNQQQPQYFRPMPGAATNMMPFQMPMPGSTGQPQMRMPNATPSMPGGPQMPLPTQSQQFQPSMPLQQQPAPTPQSTNPFSLNRPQGQTPNFAVGQATNKLVNSMSMSLGASTFTPSGAKPTNSAPGMTVSASVFQPSTSKPFVPSNPFMPTTGGMSINQAAPVFKPQAAPAPVVKAEPPKEKTVLLIERIVKGSSTDVKNDAITADDSKSIDQMKTIFNTVKTEKKITVDLLSKLLDQMARMEKLPEDLVSKSVHQRLIKRGDDGENKPLIDKKEGRMGRPNGENINRRPHNNNYNKPNHRGGGRPPNRAQNDFHHRQPYNEPVYDEKWRAEKDTLETNMHKQAAANMEEAKKAKDEHQKVRLNLNLISPDNLDRKMHELRVMLIGDRKLLGEPDFDESQVDGFQIPEDILKIVVHTIFRKAQVEHTYSKFYSKICSSIVKIDLESQGKKAVTSNLKFCAFREILLGYCRSCFEQIFEEQDFETCQKKAVDAGKTYSQADHKDEMRKRQHKLFGNIEFIGELYIRSLLRDATAKSIFMYLLQEDCYQDDTVEAAIKFIEKIGPTIEEKLAGENSATKKKFTAEEYKEILDNFVKIWQRSEQEEEGTRQVSKRIQKLIQNMIENQKMGWTKLKSAAADVKTKREVEAEMIKKLQAEQQNRQMQRDRDDDGYGGGGGRGRGRDRGGDARRDDRRDDRGGDARRDDRRDGEKVYMKKQTSVMSNASEQSNKGGRGRRGTQGRGGNNEQQRNSGAQQQRQEPIKLNSDELQTKVQVLFNKFVKTQSSSEEDKKDEVDFQVIKDLTSRGQLEPGENDEEQKTKKIRGDDILNALFAKMVDLDQKAVATHFKAFMQAWYAANVVQSESWKFMVNRAITELENYVADLPQLTVWLSDALICPLLSKGTIRLNDLVWFKEELKDELFDVHAQFEIAAKVLDSLREEGKQTQDQIAEAWTATHGEAFQVLNEALEDHEKSDLEQFLEENIETSRAWVQATLGLSALGSATQGQD